jgi:hypothetical protein
MNGGMDKILQIKVNPTAGMENLKHNLRRALKIEPARMEAMIALDNEAREEMRIRTGRQKPGPKPKNGR